MLGLGESRTLIIVGATVTYNEHAKWTACVWDACRAGMALNCNMKVMYGKRGAVVTRVL